MPLLWWLVIPEPTGEEHMLEDRRGALDETASTTSFPDAARSPLLLVPLTSPNLSVWESARRDSTFLLSAYHLTSREKIKTHILSSVSLEETGWLARPHRSASLSLSLSFSVSLCLSSFCLSLLSLSLSVSLCLSSFCLSLLSLSLSVSLCLSSFRLSLLSLSQKICSLWHHHWHCGFSNHMFNKK